MVGTSPAISSTASPARMAAARQVSCSMRTQARCPRASAPDSSSCSRRPTATRPSNCPNADRQRSRLTTRTSARGARADAGEAAPAAGPRAAADALYYHFRFEQFTRAPTPSDGVRLARTRLDPPTRPDSPGRYLSDVRLGSGIRLTCPCSRPGDGGELEEHGDDVFGEPVFADAAVAVGVDA